MAAIRGFWTFVLPGIGFIVSFVADNWANLGIARIPVALILGALAYATKRYIDPDGKW